jgi:exodeoxyribonuclease VII small subunit
MTGEEKPVSEMSFEEALAALERVVADLEGGRVPLEQSIALYERGEALRKRCETLLNEAELKVQKIVANAEGEVSLEEERAPAQPAQGAGGSDGDIPF